MAKRKVNPELDDKIAKLMEREVERAAVKEQKMQERLDTLDEDDAEYKKISRKLNKAPRKETKRGHDSILMGKKHDPVKEEEVSHIIEEVSDASAFQFDKNDKTFGYHYQSTSSMNMQQDIELQDKILVMLRDELHVMFTRPKDDPDYAENDPKTWYYPRRKPSKPDFNQYMKYCLSKLDTRIYTHCQIFYHLAHYFSDKVVNMFKLLDSDVANVIIQELSDNFRKDKKLIVKHLYKDKSGNESYRDVDLSNMEPQ